VYGEMNERRWVWSVDSVREQEGCARPPHSEGGEQWQVFVEGGGELPTIDTGNVDRQPGGSDSREPGREGIAGRLAHEGGSLPIPTDDVVGRDGDVGALDQLLADPNVRLLTLTGPPGVGKTRLAIAAAAAVAHRFPDGVTFVDLTEIRDPSLVPGAILGAIGCEAKASPAIHHVARALTRKEMLLLIDNFEHVLDAGPTMVAFLAACPGIKLLLTSRERLHLRAEREIPVRPLALSSTGDECGLLPAAPAVEMLVQRVRQFEPGFEVTQANHAALAEICARLDGLPLALELAAARLRLFTPGELTFRLRHRMTVLTSTIRDIPPRHRTLRAALTWSHDLLGPDERAAFRRLSVFVGGATVDAVREVCDLDDPVTTIASLVDKSLLHRRVRPGGVAEFVMLQSLREYAAERLVEHGEEEAANRRHARYFADLAMLVEQAVDDSDDAAWVESVRLEQGNLRKALAHAAAEADAGLSLPLASALGWYASRRGARPAPPDHVSALVDPARPHVVADSVTRALLVAGVSALASGDLDEAEALLARVPTVDEDLRDTAIATALRGHLARARGQPDEAVVHHARAAGMFSELGNASGVAWSRFDLAVLARHQGDPDRAADHLRESLTHFRDMGDARAAACATWALVTMEMHRDRAGDAERPPIGLLPVAADGSRRRPASALTTRERQVARLVADGSTNRQIAHALGIAEKTTEAHVHNIISKLGAHNRAEVAARVSAPDGLG
jgi:predicted ATPase/DNA-binding CsgD family transcriptional regulator